MRRAGRRPEGHRRHRGRRRRLDEPLDSEGQELVELAVFEEADDGGELALGRGPHGRPPESLPSRYP